MEKNGNGTKNRKIFRLIGAGAVVILVMAAIGIKAGKDNCKKRKGSGGKGSSNEGSGTGGNSNEGSTDKGNGNEGSNTEGSAKQVQEDNAQDQQRDGNMQNVGNRQRSPEEEEDNAVIAMYIPFGDGGHIFAGEQAGVFTATFPDEIYDAEGNKITKEQLVKGNVVKIYGNGMMLESYPGQYPGITRMEVVEEGKPGDADVYQDVIDEIYQEPDPAEPPSLNVEYTDSLAIVTVMTGRGGYEWVYTDEDGLSNAVVADAAHVLDWKEIADIVIDGSVDLTLYFSSEPQEVEAVRYDSSLAGKAQENPQGEKISVEKKGGKFTISGVTPGYIYNVTGIWENGKADYGFITVLRK